MEKLVAYMLTLPNVSTDGEGDDETAAALRALLKRLAASFPVLVGPESRNNYLAQKVETYNVRGKR